MQTRHWYNNTGTATGRDRLVLLALIFTLTGAALLKSSTAQSAADLTIHLLDVGQGDAMLLHQPGSCAMVIDAGPLINGHRLTAKAQQLGIDQLDLVIVSHPHLDHFGGLFDLLPRIPTRQLFDNGLENGVVEYFDDYRLLRLGQPYREIARTESLTCGDIELNVLHPSPNPDPEDRLNNTSLAMMIRFGSFRLLHMGDVAGEGERRFLESNRDLSADVIKIAHHGAADSASEELLKRVAPDLALISTATTNRIDSPAPEVLSRLDNMNIRYLRTDHSGDIEIAVTSGSYRVQANGR